MLLRQLLWQKQTLTIEWTDECTLVDNHRCNLLQISQGKLLACNLYQVSMIRKCHNRRPKHKPKIVWVRDTEHRQQEHNKSKAISLLILSKSKTKKASKNKESTQNHQQQTVNQQQQNHHHRTESSQVIVAFNILYWPKIYCGFCCHLNAKRFNFNLLKSIVMDKSKSKRGYSNIFSKYTFYQIKVYAVCTMLPLNPGTGF